MQPAKEKYLEMSLDLFPAAEYEQLAANSGEADEKELLPRKAELFLPYDLKIVCAMLDEGYSLKETAEALNECSMLAKRLPEPMPDEQRRYADEVMGRVNELREHEVGKDYGLAEGFYLSRAGGKTLNIAQEGDIVLSMLAEGFAPETVEQVLQAHGEDDGFSQALTRTCLRVARIYKAIRAKGSVTEIRTAKDAYLSLAGEYMRQRKLSKMNGKSDRDIVRRMAANGWTEDAIRKALRFSPVAAEPWRDKERYVDAVCSCVLQKRKAKNADERYALTASLYEEKMSRLLRAMFKRDSADVEANRAYYDGIVARELLEEHQPRANIERVIAEKSPQARKETGKHSAHPRFYANFIVSAAYAALLAEYALLESAEKQIPAGSSYAALKAHGITADILYRSAILRRVRDCPSTAGMLTAPFIDRDAAEHLLSRYPGMDRRDLEDALRFGSPRAQMPGIGKDYPVRVVDEVLGRMEAFAERQRKQREFRRKMEEYAQSEKNTFTAGGPTWNLALCTGLAAVRMLQAGYAAMDVLPALVQPPDIMEADAEKIVMGAETVLSRMELLRQYAPLSDAEKEQIGDRAELARDEYRRLYQAAREDRDRLMSDLDVGIARDMILSGHEKDNVIAAVRLESPVAVEPGREKDYAEYVEKQAEAAIKKEQERLKYYRPMPRNEHEEDAGKEYEHHLEAMRSAFFLPHAPAMDMLIAEAMLAQGFQAAAIGAAMQKLSPCVKNDEQYGNAILRSLESKPKGFSRAIEPLVRVRSLG